MNKPVSRTGVGASSILLVILTVCLTVFAVLALVSARNDRKLTQNTLQSVQAYYRAEAEAQSTLAKADEALCLDRPERLAALGVQSRADGSLTFFVQSADDHVLEVAFTGSGEELTVLRYRYQIRASDAADAQPGVQLLDPKLGGGN